MLRVAFSRFYDMAHRSVVILQHKLYIIY